MKAWWQRPSYPCAQIVLLENRTPTGHFTCMCVYVYACIILFNLQPLHLNVAVYVCVDSTWRICGATSLSFSLSVSVTRSHMIHKTEIEEGKKEGAYSCVVVGHLCDDVQKHKVGALGCIECDDPWSTK